MPLDKTLLDEIIAARLLHDRPEAVSLQQALNWLAFKVPPLATLSLESASPVPHISERDIQAAKLTLLTSLIKGNITAYGYAEQILPSHFNTIQSYSGQCSGTSASIFADVWRNPDSINWERSEVIGDSAGSNKMRFYNVRLYYAALQTVFIATEKSSTSYDTPKNSDSLDTDSTECAAQHEQEKPHWKNKIARDNDIYKQISALLAAGKKMQDATKEVFRQNKSELAKRIDHGKPINTHTSLKRLYYDVKKKLHPALHAK